MWAAGGGEHVYIYREKRRGSKRERSKEEIRRGRGRHVGEVSLCAEDDTILKQKHAKNKQQRQRQHLPHHVSAAASVSALGVGIRISDLRIQETFENQTTCDRRVKSRIKRYAYLNGHVCVGSIPFFSFPLHQPFVTPSFTCSQLLSVAFRMFYLN